jgi:hypothetical protein
MSCKKFSTEILKCENLERRWGLFISDILGNWGGILWIHKIFFMDDPFDSFSKNER